MSIRAFCETYDIGRTKVYAEINAGRLKARKAGTRTIIGDDDAEEWWRSLPAIKRDFSQGMPLTRGAQPPARTRKARPTQTLNQAKRKEPRGPREFRIEYSRLNLRNLLRTKKEAPTQIKSRN